MSIHIIADDFLSTAGRPDLIEKVDLVFADPPFNIGKDYGPHSNDRNPPCVYSHWTDRWMNKCQELLAPGGSMWVAINDENAGGVLHTASEFGLFLRNWVVWHYRFGQNCTTKFSRCHTHLLHFVKDLPVPRTFNVDAVRIPSDRQLKYGDKRAVSAGKVPGDVWDFPRVCGTHKERRDSGHPCQMPEAVLDRIIRACSNPEDLVLDPFVGTGTTPAVCAKLRRNFVGWEINPEYADAARERVQESL